MGPGRERPPRLMAGNEDDQSRREGVTTPGIHSLRKLTSISGGNPDGPVPAEHFCARDSSSREINGNSSPIDFLAWEAKAGSPFALCTNRAAGAESRSSISNASVIRGASSWIRRERAISCRDVLFRSSRSAVASICFVSSAISRSTCSIAAASAGAFA